jgi:hypothetical protein
MRWDGHLAGTKVQRAGFGHVEERERVPYADLGRPCRAGAFVSWRRRIRTYSLDGYHRYLGKVGSIPFLFARFLSGDCRKYRILEDCTRLREVIEAFPTDRHYVPSLLCIAWSERDPESSKDFDDMVGRSVILAFPCSFRL